MRSFECTVTDAMGLHARPAGLLAKRTAQYQSKIMLQYDGKEIACNRLLAIMKMAVKQGAVVTFTIEGPDEDTAYEDFKRFCLENI